MAFAADKPAKAPARGPDWIPFDDPKLEELLRKIEAAGAYDIPAVNLKKDENYAQTPVDKEFGGTQPFKENFLSQLTTGGRGGRRPSRRAWRRSRSASSAPSSPPCRSPPAARAMRRRSASPC